MSATDQSLERAVMSGARVTKAERLALVRKIQRSKAELRGSRRGGRQTSEYAAWTGMVQRCANPDNKRFPLYGGRGITVCARWRASFENFLADMGRKPSAKHSLDRINVNGHYEPSNCRWATWAEQHRNKRNNVFITFGDRTMCLRDWALAVGVTYSALRKRLSKWPLERALTAPPALDHQHGGGRARPTVVA